MASAQDKATLDLLVSKNLISREEADKLAKNESAPVVAPRYKETQKFSVFGLVQAQYYWAGTHEYVPNNSNLISKTGFQMRRMFIGIKGELGHGFSATVVADFASSAENARYLDSAYISKKFDGDILNGTLDIGYTKPQFSQEENRSATALLAIERSLASKYFIDAQAAGSGSVGFGSRYVGVFWNGKIRAVEGLTYGFSLTNAQNFSIKPATSAAYDSNVNLWANVAYANTINISETALAYKLGFNFGYGSGANSTLNGGDSNGAIWGVNPYLQLNYGGFTLLSDFIMTGIEYGANAGTEYSKPWGANVALEYKFDIGELGAIAPVIRYSFLDTDGRGFRASDAMLGANNIAINGTNMYARGQSIYLGLNWYVIGNAIKLQAGYEWAQLEGSPSGYWGAKSSDVNTVRVQMQAVF